MTHRALENRSHFFEIPTPTLNYKVARWQNFIPSLPWIAPGRRAWGRNPSGNLVIQRRSGNFKKVGSIFQRSVCHSTLLVDIFRRYINSIGNHFIFRCARPPNASPHPIEVQFFIETALDANNKQSGLPKEISDLLAEMRIA